MFGRKKVAALVAEFLGTGALTLAVVAVQRSQLGLAYFVAIAAGITVAGLTFLFSEASGAYFNPALTLGAWAVGRIRAAQALSYFIVQLLGGWTAYGVFTYMVNTSLPAAATKFTWHAFVAEALGTFIFALIWAAVAFKKLSAGVVGVGLAAGALIASIATGVGFANPAVALGARAWIIGDFTHYAGWWGFALAPIVGGVLGFVVYHGLFADGLPYFNLSRAAAATAPVAVKTVPARSAVAEKATRAKAKKAPAKKKK